MNEITVTKTRIVEGIWEGVVSGTTDKVRPEITVLHLDKEVPGIELTPDAEISGWRLRVPIPAQAISEGVHTFLIVGRSDGAVLDRFSLIAGDALADDLRAEVDLLRAELDMLKRAFRRHCVETA